MPLTPEARDLVARTILGETGSQDQASMAAVANVIKNRLNSGAWGPDTKIGPVIKAPKQFSMWNNDPKMQAYAARINAVPTNDPGYQRAGAVADAVFNDQMADNTGGATNFYANKGPNAIAAPSWAAGQQGQQFGDQIFFKLPLTASNTAGTGVISPSTVGVQAPAVVSSVGNVNGGQTPQDPGIDLRHLDPVFRARIDQLRADAAAAGIQTHIVSGYRDNTNQAGLYQKHLANPSFQAAPPGESYHNFGRAVDIIADDPKQQSALTELAAQPWRNIRPGATFGDYDHYETVEGRTALLTEPGHIAVPVGAPSEVPHPDASSSTTPSGHGGIGSDAAAVSRVVNPNVPAAQAQAVSAATPAGQPDPNARFQVLHAMGQGGMPGLPYTALNLTPGAGSTSAAAPAPAAPATPPAATPDLTQRVPLNQTPPPPPRPTPSAIGAYPDSTNYPTGLGLTPPTQTSSMPQPFQTSLSNPVQAFLSRLFQTG